MASLLWQSSHQNHIWMSAHPHNILPPATSPHILNDYLNFLVRALYLGSVDQMSCVVSWHLIHTYILLLRILMSSVKGTPLSFHKKAARLEKASKCREKSMKKKPHHDDWYWCNKWNALRPAWLKETLRNNDTIIRFFSFKHCRLQPTQYPFSERHETRKRVETLSCLLKAPAEKVKISSMRIKDWF